MEKILIPNEKRELKLEFVDPTGVVVRSYCMPYEVDGKLMMKNGMLYESMIEHRGFLTIGEHTYKLFDDGRLEKKI